MGQLLGGGMEGVIGKSHSVLGVGEWILTGYTLLPPPLRPLYSQTDLITPC